MLLKRLSFTSFRLILALIMGIVLVTTGNGQDEPESAPIQQTPTQFPSLSGLDDLVPNSFGDPPKLAIKTSCRILVTPDGGDGVLQVAADIDPGWHLYSISQQPGGPQKTTIVINRSPDFESTVPVMSRRA